MASTHKKLDTALKDLLEAYTELESELDSKYGDDEDAFTSNLVEILEGSIESAIDDQDSSTSSVASMISSLTEALETLDPSAFEGETEEEEEDDEYETEDEEIDYEELEDEDGDDDKD